MTTPAIDTFAAVGPVTDPAPSGFDRALHARFARLTQGISPASLACAYADWIVHLAMSPGKVAELAATGQRQSMRLALQAAQGATGTGTHCASSRWPRIGASKRRHGNAGRST
jgi:hypothetical protein